MRPASLMSLSLVSLFPILTMASTETSTFHYYYFKEKVPLIEETGSLAVLDEDQGSSGELTALLESVGFPPSELHRFHTPGWTIALMRSASDTPNLSGVAPVIAKLLDLDQPPRYYFSPVFAGRGGGPVIVTPTILVRFERGVSEPRISQLLASAGAREAHKEPFEVMENAFKITTRFHSGIDVLDVANRLAQFREVRFAEPNMIFTGKSASILSDDPEVVSLIPNDPEFPNCWGLHNTGQFPGSVPGVDIAAPGGWAFTTGDPSVIVVVIDVGVDQDHLDINQIPGNDFTDQPGAVRDGGPVNECDNHGTAVAGVVSAIINNGRGTVGVAPGTRIASARAFKSTLDCNDRWTTESMWTVEALQWAESIGARITNNSNIYDSTSSIITDTYQETRDRGMIHFASAGNEGNNEVGYPASLPSVNAISAITYDGSLASFSNSGSEIMFGAPGDAIFTSDRTGVAGYSADDITVGSGTSFATPMVSGIVALLFSFEPTLTVQQAEDYLRLAAQDLGPPGRDDFYGWGLPKSSLALKAAAIHAIFFDGFEAGDISMWSSSQ